ncbi:ABC transporter ATP-binding protein [Pararhizobium sp. PWRC1-1]|uniref:ABC transporter ATP-binding protein n=1 Tax=Pararhizobium sp. PWRC1-1 TaxID=2804566 RepID=UPI003CF75065
MTQKAAPALLVDDVHKSYGIHEVLKGISLSARKGDVISIIGSSGSGKSTFLRCINFLEIPDRGRFVINGEEVLMKTGAGGRVHPANWRQIERLRTGLGMVFQSFNLWPHMTVLENVIEAPVHVLGMNRKEAIDRAESLLSKVGLHDKRSAYPAFLSGGQQQRASIARALCVDPAVMLFDEPTSALDPELVGEVLKVIRELAEEGRTMLLVTHEMKFARDVSSHVMFLHQGRVEEEGPPAQIFGTPTSARCRQFTNTLPV